MVIEPTVGRIVYFYETATDKTPQAAIVVAVRDNRLVDLVVFHARGGVMFHPTVKLVQPDDELPHSSYCAWMPYQIDKAKERDTAAKAAAAALTAIPAPARTKLP